MSGAISKTTLTASNNKRLKPTQHTLRKLYLYSGNQCALTGCSEILIDEDGSWIGEVAHIHAALNGGPRANTNLTDEERRRADNLILLCRNCHVKIDQQPEKYPADKLKEVKNKHEGRFKRGLRSAEFKDASDQDEIVIPKSFSVWDCLESDQENAEFRQDVEDFAKRLSKLPISTRHFLTHALRRSKFIRREFQVLATELMGVLEVGGSALNEMKLIQEVEILEQHGFAYWDKEGDRFTGYLNIENDDKTIFETTFDLAGKKAGQNALPDLGIIEDVIVRLDFTSFQ